MKNLFRSVDILRNAGTYMYDVMEPKEKEFLGEDPINVLYKVDKGIEMIN